MRDDFTKETKHVIAARVGFHCSNPNCMKPTSGPHTESDKVFNLGEAAHITAASPGGPRYDETLNPDERRSPENGIWLCRTCSRAIDADPAAFTVEELRQWKEHAERHARAMLQPPGGELAATLAADVSRAERFGSDQGVILPDGAWVPFAVVFDPDSESPTYYETGGYVVRFMVAKRPGVNHALVSAIRAVVHRCDTLPPYQYVPCAYPYETSLYVVELLRPGTEAACTCTAERFFVVTDRQKSVAWRFSPLLLSDDVPETIDVRFTAREPGLYTVSLEVVVTHGITSQSIQVLEPTKIAFGTWD